jgi:hypothetical protein
MDETSANDEESEAIERVLRIAQLRAEVEAVAGSPIVGEGGVGGTLETQESFWSHIHAIETAPYMSLKAALLERRGLIVVPPDQFSTDDDLREALWQLLTALASMRVFFHHTDHLSDRTFYCLLFNEVLPQETQIMPDDSGWNNRYDMADPPTADMAETNGIYLKYYADDAERDYWRHEFPEDTMPHKTELPYNRDRRLPIPAEEQRKND